MKKKNYIIIVVIGVLIILTLAIKLIHKNANFDNSKTITELDKLKQTLVNSKYFENSNFDTDEKNLTLTIDQKYKIEIMAGFYRMTIVDNSDVYCKVVDAVEMSLELEKGKSITTCEETIQGKINLGGINYETVDGIKYLTVNIDDRANLYEIDNTYKDGDIISIKDEKYDIKSNGFTFSTMSFGFTQSANLYCVCGHVYGENVNTGFMFKIYDKNKNELAEKTFEYDNSSKKYKTFCVEYDLNQNNVDYYSISKL